jgi:hypothetical protein
MILGAGLVLPVTFVTGAQAMPLVQLAYDDQSDSGPLQPFPAENNPNVTPSDLGPPLSGGAQPANSALEQAQHLNEGTETPGQGYDNGSGPDDSSGSGPGEATSGSGPGEATSGSGPGEATSGSGPGEATTGSGPAGQSGPMEQPAPVAPLPPVAPAVAANPQYQQLSTQYTQAVGNENAAATQAQQAQAQWDAVKANPNVSQDTLTAAYNNQQATHNAAVWAEYQAQQLKAQLDYQTKVLSDTVKNMPQ